MAVKLILILGIEYSTILNIFLFIYFVHLEVLVLSIPLLFVEFLE